ncbi:MAG: peptidase [Clostridiales bacterium]|nr:MAG: peptidase [Clostridiales bacterium]
MPYFFMDYWYIILVIPAIIFSLIAQAKVNSTYAHAAKTASQSGLTGKDIAERILRQNGINDVYVVPIKGNLTDNYNPRTKTISLSEGVYDSTSVAALGIAAHEAGHTCQHYQNYSPISVRNAILPVANIGSSLAIPLVLIGFLFSWQPLVLAGIVFFAAVVLFQLVTLPVEFNASNRAIKVLESGVLQPDELAQTKKVLSAAAMTYVAALAVSLAQLLRLILLARGDDRR